MGRKNIPGRGTSKCKHRGWILPHFSTVWTNLDYPNPDWPLYVLPVGSFPIQFSWHSFLPLSLLPSLSPSIPPPLILSFASLLPLPRSGLPIPDKTQKTVKFSLIHPADCHPAPVPSPLGLELLQDRDQLPPPPPAHMLEFPQGRGSSSP